MVAALTVVQTPAGRVPASPPLRLMSGSCLLISRPCRLPSLKKSMITPLLQPCPAGQPSARLAEDYSAAGGGPLRIGCKVSVTVIRTRRLSSWTMQPG